MSSIIEEEDESIRQASREWLLRLELDEPSSEDQQAFRTWCAEDARHAEAYKKAGAIWHESAALTGLADLAPLDKLPERKRPGPRRAIEWLAATAALAAGIAAFVLFFADRPEHYTTQIAEVRAMALSDGSRLTLGAQSAVDVAITKSARHVTLKEGEAFFTVAKDSLRPFVVTVGDKTVRALGTQFEVRRERETLRVAVVEGSVEVSQSGTKPHRLIAGQQIVAHLRGGIETAQPIKSPDPAAWRNGRLVYIDAPLREVVSDANRYSRDRIELAGEGVGELRVSVNYRADQVNEMINGLAQSLPIEVTHPADGPVILRRSDREP